MTTLQKQEEANSFQTNNPDRMQALSDGELAELMQSADPDRIRSATPRMPPELRRIAEMALKEIESGSK